MRRISRSLSRCIAVLSQLTLRQLRCVGLVITVVLIVGLAQFVSPLLNGLSQSVVAVAVLGTILPMVGLVITITVFSVIELAQFRANRALMFQQIDQLRNNS